MRLSTTYPKLENIPDMILTGEVNVNCVCSVGTGLSAETAGGDVIDRERKGKWKKWARWKQRTIDST